MAKRQKILIILMVVAILYAVFELFIKAPVPDPGEPTEARMENARQFSETMNAAIEDLELNPEELQVLNMASRSPEFNPFYQWPHGQRPEETASPVEDGLPVPLTYEGYIELGETRLAVINGQEYQEGELMAAEGLRIVEILPDQVTLDSENTDQSFTIPYEEALF